MAVQELPLLPEDYPLFDWADWPDSRAALVQGGETRLFEKACWNAIVGALTDGLEAAGIELYRAEEGLTPDHLKMLSGVYGRLTAALFNTVRASIDDVIPFHWAWAVDRSFRGYVGRAYFVYRHGDYGMEADIVYPEYILELARRVNLLLEILRGTAATGSIGTEHHSAITVSPGVRAGKSVPVGGGFFLKTILDAAGQAAIGAPVQLKALDIPHSSVAVDPLAGKAASVSAWVKNPLPIKVGGTVRSPAAMDPGDILVRSAAYADLVIYQMLELASEYAASSLTGAQAQTDQAIRGEASALSVSGTLAEMDQLPLLAGSAGVTMGSEATADLKRAESSPVKASHISESAASVWFGWGTPVNSGCEVPSAARIALEGTTGDAAPCGAEAGTMSVMDAEAHAGEALPGAGEHLSALAVGISAVKGKIRPGWAEKLSGSSVQAEVDHLTAAVVDAPRNSRVTVLCTFGSAWDPPIWEQGGLWIRQARTIKICADGSMDLSGSGDPIAAMQTSTAVVLCTLDTAWYPPQMVDGGLWIRQVQTAVRNENNELEVY